jgi:Ca-activated chloride channel family protein
VGTLGFDAPGRLWLLLGVLGLAGLHVWRQRRRSRFAVRFPELELLLSVVPRRSRWLRHVPAALLLLALTGTTAAYAEPTAEVSVPRERATVVVTLDVSASMMATDVSPDRISAAKEAAQAFVDRLPDTFDVGLVSFSGSASVVVPPTTDHASVQSAIDALQLGPSTAIGEAVLASLQAVQSVDATGGVPAPARIVLLSDGANTAGRPISAAVEQAAAAGVPVSTIAYGTDEGTVVVQGQLIPVPVDGPALAALAEGTGGQAYSAESGEELSGVYADIGAQVGTTRERRDVSARLAGLALVAALGACVAALVWSPRLL